MTNCYWLVMMVGMLGAVATDIQPGVLAKEIKKEGHSPSKVLELASELVELERGADALASLEALFENEDALKQEEKVKGHYLLAAAMRQKMGQNPLAWMMGRGSYIDHLTRAIELDATYTPPYEELIGFYSNAPSIAGGSHDKAFETAVRLTHHDPLNGLLHQARIWSMKGKDDKALETFKEAAARFPNEDRVFYQLGMFAIAEQNYSDAKTYFDQGLALSGDLAQSCRYQAGKSRVLLKEDLDAGIELFEAYIQHFEQGSSPTRSDALWRMGLIYRLKDQPEKARDCFQRAIQLQSDHKLAKEALDEMG